MAPSKSKAKAEDQPEVNVQALEEKIEEQAEMIATLESQLAAAKQSLKRFGVEAFPEDQPGKV